MPRLSPQRFVEPGPKRRGRRLLWASALALLLLIGAVALSPRLLGTPPARAWLVARVNARIAPGSIQLAGISPSWTGPIELRGLALVDPKGKRVVTARRVRLNRGLLGLMGSRRDFGKIVVEGAAIDVERRADGSIDLLEALGMGTKPDGSAPTTAAAPTPAGPGPKVAVVIEDGTLRLASPELVGPIVADSLAGTATLAPGRPIEVAATLGDAGRSLDLGATVARDSSTGDLAVTVAGKGWPIHVLKGGAEVRCRFDGRLEASRKGGTWSAGGDATLGDFRAEGPALAGDRLLLGRVARACDLGPEVGGGWSVRRFDLACPVATVKASGGFPSVAGQPTRLRGEVDLAALAKMVPRAMKLRDGLAIERGKATIRLDLAARDGSDRLELAATIADLVAVEGGRRFALREAPVLVASAGRSKGKVTVEKAEVRAAGVDVTGGGDLDSGVTLKGTVDLTALRDQLDDLLDLGEHRFSGQVRLAADYHRHGEDFKGRMVVDGRDLAFAGWTAEPILRDSARLDAWIAGPGSADGLPADWRSARLDLKAGDLLFELAANSQNGELALAGLVGLEVASPTAGRAEARFALRRKGPVLDFEILRLALRPADPTGVLTFTARGRVDLEAGEVTFAALPGSHPGAIGLGPEGLKVTGLGRAGAPLKVDAALFGDLAALDLVLASWSGSTPKGLAGHWAGRLNGARTKGGRVDLDGRLDLDKLADGPASLAVRAGYSPESDRLDLAAFDLTTAYGRAVASGGVDGAAKGRRLAEVRGTIDPRWDVIGPILAKSAGPGATARATFRPFHLAGPLAGDSKAAVMAGISGELGLDLASAEAFGVRVGPAAVVLELGGGLAKFKPIATTINDGPTLINANLGLDDANGLWLRLDRSRIEGAAIDDAVSEALISYMAPVLSKATEVNGKLIVVLDDKAADLPITATGPARVDGVVAFQDVQFRPGPLAAQVLSLTGRPAPKLALTQPVRLQVADRQVKTSGMSIAIGGGSKVDFDGAVGFDQTLNCRATIPLTASMLGRPGPDLDKLVAGRKITLPIGGTLSRPSIDRRAFQVALRDTAKSLVGTEVEAEAGRLLDRVAGPGPDGKKGNNGRDAIRGLLQGLGREAAPKKP